MAKKSKAKTKTKTPEEQLQEAKSDIHFLARCPADFRDIPPSSSAWFRYAKLMGVDVATAMEQWLHGSIVVSGEPLDQRETFCFASHPLICIPRGLILPPLPPTFEELVGVIAWARQIGASYIYLKDLTLGVVDGLNKVLSYTRNPIRFMARIESTFAKSPGGKQHRDDGN